MRRRKSDLHARVKRNLPLEFDDVRLTSYAGLELLERDLRTSRVNQLVREAFADLPRWGDFGGCDSNPLEPLVFMRLCTSLMGVEI